MPETVIPHNCEAEESVIGSVLINSDEYHELHFLKADDFYIHRHRWIWSAFASLYSRREQIDVVTVADELDRLGLLAEAGGSAFLTAVIARLAISSNAESYGRIVEAHATRRKLIQAANEIANFAYDEKMEIEVALDKSLAAMYAVADRQTHKEVTIGQALSEAYDQSYEASKSGSLVGISTGFVDLDRYLGGLKNGKLYDVAGRPGKGKTALVLDFAIKAAFDLKKHVRIFSQEMNSTELAVRVAAKRLGIDTKKIEDGLLNEQEWQKYLELIDETQSYDDYPIVIDETTPLTPITLHAICQNSSLRGKLDLVVIDYAQLLEGDGFTLREKITDVSRNMKRLARRLNIPVVAAVQLSRNAAEGKPKISDLQETGALEQDADVVMLLHEDEEVQGLMNVIIGKHRGGPIGQIDLTFRRPLTRFENASTKVFSPNGKDRQ